MDFQFAVLLSLSLLSALFIWLIKTFVPPFFNWCFTKIPFLRSPVPDGKETEWKKKVELVETRLTEIRAYGN